MLGASFVRAGQGSDGIAILLLALDQPTSSRSPSLVRLR